MQPLDTCHLSSSHPNPARTHNLWAHGEYIEVIGFQNSSRLNEYSSREESTTI